MDESIIWLIKLILAHLISDFALQPKKWVTGIEQHKIRSKYLYWHTLVTGLAALLLIGFNYWAVVLIITISHYVITVLKLYTKNNFVTFTIGQLLHLAVIIACWLVIFEQHRPGTGAIAAFYSGSRFWTFAAAAFFLTLPSSVIIGQATRQWAVPAGLKNAGKYIGIIERILICLLVYQGHYEAIGLLITGKSILRYNSSNEEVKTEYLLVGTLLSIFIAFAVGLALKVVV
ncbi:DUF3307 domain-containing protein [Mucilaginibacter sp. AK015]|uniref:DUF3307 domain-containing protein n=1 Tax=Mucilaginibacter sp. AK015 TaxID=2723072 RepID=UPI00161BFBD1|nr:DUF3307 domain-containing protein [Mucilaginibacter sp. AK015]MBB5395616.1 magnesium-transporting ATPase (P-type) [Mucilaginibacter sp. AK015]